MLFRSSLVRKYTRAKKLTPRMLNELVEKIDVSFKDATSARFVIWDMGAFSLL